VGTSRYNRCMDTRIERVVLETDRHLIVGDLHMPREGYRSRLSDFLTRGDVRFVPLANAEIRSLNGEGRVEQRDFLAVSRSHITLAYLPSEREERAQPGSDPGGI
jgi:hypothetical protein